MKSKRTEKKTNQERKMEKVSRRATNQIHRPKKTVLRITKKNLNLLSMKRDFISIKMKKRISERKETLTETEKKKAVMSLNHLSMRLELTFRVRRKRMNLLTRHLKRIIMTQFMEKRTLISVPSLV